MGNFQQQQLNAIIAALANGKLFSELVELAQVTDDNTVLGVNTGQADALFIKVSKLRGFLGNWNAATNTPTLADGVGIAGDTYRCNSAGTVNFGSGDISISSGDIVMYDGSTWLRLSASQASGDMLKSIYDPEDKEEDVYKMDFSEEPSSSISLIDDADRMNVFDSTADIYVRVTWANVKSVLKTYFDSIFAPILGRTVRATSLTGTYSIDWNALEALYFGIDDTTITFTDSNLPALDKNKVITLYNEVGLDTDAIVFPSYWQKDAQSDDFIGDQKNRITVECISGSTGFELVYYSITNLE